MKNPFAIWWKREGRGQFMAAATMEDVKRVAAVAWSNGAYCASPGDRRKATAWGVIHNDGSLCVNLIRRTRKAAMQAQCEMFPHMTRATFRQLGFRIRKVTITCPSLRQKSEET